MARVVAVEADGPAESADLGHEPADGAGRGDSRRQSSTTRAGSTSPSNGQPKATLTVTVQGRSAAVTIAWTRASASSTDALALRRLKDSVAASVQLTRSSVVARSRS
jgi:hypothetical protein